MLFEYVRVEPTFLGLIELFAEAGFVVFEDAGETLAVEADGDFDFDSLEDVEGDMDFDLEGAEQPLGDVSLKVELRVVLGCLDAVLRGEPREGMLDDRNEGDLAGCEGVGLGVLCAFVL